MTTHTWHGPQGWTLLADRSQVFLDDPGQGTPLMVHAPNDTAQGTLLRVQETAEADANNGTILEVPDSVLAWLDKVEDDANAWVFA